MHEIEIASVDVSKEFAVQDRIWLWSDNFLFDLSEIFNFCSSSLTFVSVSKYTVTVS
jgi:hypothetical protein